MANESAGKMPDALDKFALRTLRSRLKVSQEAVANVAGVKRSFVADLEYGRTKIRQSAWPVWWALFRIERTQRERLAEQIGRQG